MNEYASLVKEALEFRIPRAKPRQDIIRQLPKPASFNLVHIITGMRRSGKTFYLFQIIASLLEQGVPRDRIFYFNFADDRLKPIPPSLMADVLDEYYRQVPAARTEGAYLFLDEVQVSENWQGVCQRVAEHENVTLVITGSSSKVSSEEIATEFRGRSHAHEMLPLSFREYCIFKEIDLPAADEQAFSPQTTTALEASFDRYLIEGGFPGVQHLGNEDRIEVLQGYVRDVVARDAADRLGRENIALANQMALFGLRNTACELSVNKLVEQLRAVGFKIYWEKADQLLSLFEQSFLLHFLNQYATALKIDSTAVQKVYAADPGLVYAISRANQQDIGKRLETAVYLELRRRNAGKRTEAITSFTLPSARQEKVDFLVGDSLSAEPYALFQVSATMEAEKTRHREISSLEAAMAALAIDQGTIITLREEETVHVNAGTIHVVPAWKWLLQS